MDFTFQSIGYIKGLQNANNLFPATIDDLIAFVDTRTDWPHDIREEILEKLYDIKDNESEEGEEYGTIDEVFPDLPNPMEYYTDEDN